MRYVPLYVLAVYISIVIILEARYSVYAVDIVYPSTVTLFRYKVIAIVYVFS